MRSGVAGGRVVTEEEEDKEKNKGERKYFNVEKWEGVGDEM